MNDSALDAVLSTLLWASLSTAIVLVPAVLLAYLLARRSFPGKQVLSTMLSLPLVLPPTAVGYLLLRTLAYDGFLGAGTIGFDLDIILTWKAVVVACAVMSIPLVVRTARVAFESVDPRFADISRTLGHGRTLTFLQTTLPLARRGLIAAAILGFTRALGEFGATIILAGNIPGITRTIPLAIYEYTSTPGGDRMALSLSLVSIGLSFLVLLIGEAANRSLARR
jgi:molybdate transport system permease protein